jgi:hypothetical protein
VEVSSLALVAKRQPLTPRRGKHRLASSSVTAKRTATCERLPAPECRGGTIPERLWKRAFVLRWRIGLGQIDPPGRLVLRLIEPAAGRILDENGGGSCHLVRSSNINSVSGVSTSHQKTGPALLIAKFRLRTMSRI